MKACVGCGDTLTTANQSARCDDCCRDCAAIGHLLEPIGCVILGGEKS